MQFSPKRIRIYFERLLEQSIYFFACLVCAHFRKQISKIDFFIKIGNWLHLNLPGVFTLNSIAYNTSIFLMAFIAHTFMNKWCLFIICIMYINRNSIVLHRILFRPWPWLFIFFLLAANVSLFKMNEWQLLRGVHHPFECARCTPFMSMLFVRRVFGWGRFYWFWMGIRTKPFFSN